MDFLSVIVDPEFLSWSEICRRPDFKADDIRDKVAEILTSVRSQGDEALKRFSKKFDQIELDQLEVSEAEIQAAISNLDPALRAAIEQAAANVRKFHEGQLVVEAPVDTMPGVSCWRRSVPIESVGLYIPGGTAPLFSTVLMLAIPAAIAGCKEIALCTPPGGEQGIHPAILYSASLCGVKRIFKIGGAQAIGALAYGTETVPSVAKIFGPGNRYVTEAKMQVQRSAVAIDMPAGPSEVLVFVDETSNPEFAAADLLSQAEHGADSQVLLVGTDQTVLDLTRKAVERQLETLPRRDIASEALKHSKAVYFSELDEAIRFINIYAAEHLILLVDAHEKIASKVVNAGSVFLGHYSPESVGDYASGTNHTLPTGGWARSYSGVSVDSFVKKITFQKLTKEGLDSIGSTVEIMAENEQLIAHKRAVGIRRKSES